MDTDSVVAAVNAAAPIAVRSVGTPTGSVAQWIMTAIMTVASPGLIWGFLKFKTAMKGLSDARANQLDDERRGDMSAMRADMASLRSDAKNAATEAREAGEKVHVIENKLQTAVLAISLLASEITRIDKDNAVLIQVREMIAATMVGDLGLAAALNRIPSVIAAKHDPAPSR